MPIVELRFPNVLQTSVQVGDVAYFSNPVAVPDANIPGQNYEWEATHTPHMTNARSEIKMIGEIISIDTYVYTAQPGTSIRSHITVDGVPPVQNAGVIRCDMPQDLFNKYWDEVKQGQCQITILNTSTGTGDCYDNYTHLTDYPRFDIGNASDSTFLYNPNDIAFRDYVFTWAFDNPTIPIGDVLFHIGWGIGTTNLDNTACGTCNPSAGFFTPSNFCQVLQQSKNVPGVGNDWDPTRHNVWTPAPKLFMMNTHRGANLDGNGTGIISGGPNQQLGMINSSNTTFNQGWGIWYNIAYGTSGYSYSANLIIDKLADMYPGYGYIYGWTWQQFIQNHWSIQAQVYSDWIAQHGPNGTNLLAGTNAGGPNPYVTNNVYNNTPDSVAGVWGGGTIQFPDGSFEPDIQTNCEEPSFIMFSKDNKANMSSILGYYASTEFRNNSTDKAELFNVGTVFTESSK